MKKDTLFGEQIVEQDFQFTPKVAEVFDDMLNRSIPCYRQSMQMAAQILQEFLNPRDIVYDLGCSTGTTLLKLASELAPLDLQFIGIDSSPAMVTKATSKAAMYSSKESLSFLEGDILKTDFQEAGAIILNYTLQFIRPLLRQELLNKIVKSLRPGGILIVSEKVVSSDPLLNRSYINFYLNFKRTQGYSEIEITKKREALENILVPFSAKENLEMLKNAGFQSVEPFFQWYNFISIVAIKK